MFLIRREQADSLYRTRRECLSSPEGGGRLPLYERESVFRAYMEGGPSSIEMGEVVSSPPREGRQSPLSIEGGRPSSVGIEECVSYPQREQADSLY